MSDDALATLVPVRGLIFKEWHTHFELKMQSSEIEKELEIEKPTVASFIVD